MTERQRAANRANALKSTGPRTAAGKRRSSLNALKHGLFADAFREAMEAFGERREEFDRLHRDFIVSFGPQTPFEAALVEDLARLWWRKQRLDRGESGLQVKEVENEQFKRLREMSDANHAGIEEGNETIRQIGLVRVKDCASKFEELEQFLEVAIAQAERGDPSLDLDGLLRLLYGEQSNWRAGLIRSLAQDLSAAEEASGPETEDDRVADTPAVNTDDGIPTSFEADPGSPAPPKQTTGPRKRSQNEPGTKPERSVENRERSGGNSRVGNRKPGKGNSKIKIRKSSIVNRKSNLIDGLGAFC